MQAGFGGWGVGRNCRQGDCLWSLKGSHGIAQGNALGSAGSTRPALKGRDRSSRFRPVRAAAGRSCSQGVALGYPISLLRSSRRHLQFRPTPRQVRRRLRCLKRSNADHVGAASEDCPPIAPGRLAVHGLSGMRHSLWRDSRGYCSRRFQYLREGNRKGERWGSYPPERIGEFGRAGSHARPYAPRGGGGHRTLLRPIPSSRGFATRGRFRKTKRPQSGQEARPHAERRDEKRE